MKYAWIDRQPNAHPLPAMCAMLDVSISGYQAWKRVGTPNRKRLTDAQMLTLIRAIHVKNERVHGTRYETRAEAIADAFDSIEPISNRRRRHSTLGYASPQQFPND